MSLDDALAVLRSADSRLDARNPEPRSLDPHPRRATTLVDLGELLLADSDAEVMHEFAHGLASIVDAQVEHFPDTVFWDVDYMAKCIHRIGQAHGIRETCREIVLLQAQYGRHSPIAFRYVHDFTYGFDWAKWVAKAPDSRATIGPFDAEFIGYLRQRGDELVALIEADDEKYPKLPSGQPRNPFGFSREPDHEALLCAELARARLIPVETWRVDAVPDWQRPYAALRDERARLLNVPTRTTSEARRG